MNNFTKQKRRFFIKLALRLRIALKLHKLYGLWDGWRNVSEHCLVEVARVHVLGKLLGISNLTLTNLEIAAMLHDFNKRYETECTKDEKNWFKFNLANEEEKRRLQHHGFCPEIIELVGAVGHSSLKITSTILQKKSLTEKETAFLIMHYVDDYTIGSAWVQPAQSTEKSKINDFDHRIEKNKQNQNYRLLDEEGRKYFGGITTFEMQHRVGKEVEKTLAALLAKTVAIDPIDLPTLIDLEIKSWISSTSC